MGSIAKKKLHWTLAFILVLCISVPARSAWAGGLLSELSNRVFIDGLELFESEDKEMIEKVRAVSIDRALRENWIESTEYTIKENDTLSSILTGARIRPDPVSIQVLQELNGHKIVPTSLSPGATISILSPRSNRPIQSGQMTIYMDVFEKKELNSSFDGFWTLGQEQISSHTNDSGRENEVSGTLKNIAIEYRNLEQRGFAAPRPDLLTLARSLEKSGEILDEQSRSESGMFSESDRNFFQEIWNYLRELSAEDTTTIRVEATTVSANSGMVRDHYTVCYKIGMALINYRHGSTCTETPNQCQRPDWQCDEQFDQPTSPATKHMRKGRRFAVWAIDARNQTSSDVRLITVEPNSGSSGKFSFKIAVAPDISD